jgi:choline dehydrogenase-like flavoprotein
MPGHAHGFTLAANVTKPGSRGRVALFSPDPTVKPLIIHKHSTIPSHGCVVSGACA